MAKVPWIPKAGFPDDDISGGGPGGGSLGWSADVGYSGVQGYGDIPQSMPGYGIRKDGSEGLLPTDPSAYGIGFQPIGGGGDPYRQMMAQGSGPSDPATAASSGPDLVDIITGAVDAMGHALASIFGSAGDAPTTVPQTPGAGFEGSASGASPSGGLDWSPPQKGTDGWGDDTLAKKVDVGDKPPTDEAGNPLPSAKFKPPPPASTPETTAPEGPTTTDVPVPTPDDVHDPYADTSVPKQVIGPPEPPPPLPPPTLPQPPVMPPPIVLLPETPPPEAPPGGGPGAGWYEASSPHDSGWRQMSHPFPGQESDPLWIRAERGLATTMFNLPNTLLRGLLSIALDPKLWPPDRPPPAADFGWLDEYRLDPPPGSEGLSERYDFLVPVAGGAVMKEPPGEPLKPGAVPEGIEPGMPRLPGEGERVGPGMEGPDPGRRLGFESDESAIRGTMGAGKVPHLTPEEITQWTEHIDSRMRDVGIPDSAVGLPMDSAPVFDPQAGDIGNNIPGVGVKVDAGVLGEWVGDPWPEWESADPATRIDAVLAHEYEEYLGATHEEAISRAPDTSLAISEAARDLLRSMRDRGGR